MKASFSRPVKLSNLHLQDITLNTMAATVCGYTHEELLATFAERLDGVDMDQVRLWYDGYNFLGDRVYNPFDIPLLLDSKEFRNYGSGNKALDQIRKMRYWE